jgi:hypothetical protein
MRCIHKHMLADGITHKLATKPWNRKHQLQQQPQHQLQAISGFFL